MQHTCFEATNTNALPSELESSLSDDDAFDASSRCVVVAHIQPQSTLAECSAVLALLPPQEDQQIVCKVPIPHPEVNLVGQSQDHDLGDNNL